jgi:taurine-pyruvate aminotransferase
MAEVVRIPACYCYRCPLGREYPGCDLDCAQALAETIEKEGSDTVAAFVAEPIYGTSGDIFPPPEYIPKVREICDRYEILLILDEVITGFGRTGKNFACQHWEVVPDLMCMSKGMISSHLPLGGVALTEAVFEGMLGPDPFPHLYTTGAHPTACAVAQKNLEIMIRDKLVENSAEMGSYMLNKLKNLEKYPHVAQVQGLGLFFGIELTKDKETKEGYTKKEVDQLGKVIMDEGVIVRCADSRISLGPPLIVNENDLDQIFQAIETGLASL